MDGHKMEAFKFELSFFHWLILGVVTLGLSNVFWYLPYKVAATAEYYFCVRQLAKEAYVEGAEMLDDPVLFTKADPELLEEVYGDVARERAWLKENRIQLTGARKFFAEKLAIWVGSSENKKTYQRQENREYRMQEDWAAMHGEA